MVSQTNLKKRKHEGDARPPKRKKIRKVQQHYSSGSDSDAHTENDEFNPVDLEDSDAGSNDDFGRSEESIHSDEGARIPASSSKKRGLISASAVSNSDTDSDSGASLPSNPNKTKVSKRNDPAAFANSISAILSSKLTSAKRTDPVLARSATAAQASTEIASAKLETQAKQKLREDKKAALEKGRVKDVLLGTDAPDRSEEESGGGEKVKEIQELEKRLRKTAQRGVVKLFNAVRQAQVRAEEAAKDKATVGRARREEKVGEMSKKGFLELVAGGGGGGDKKMAKVDIEEA